MRSLCDISLYEVFSATCEQAACYADRLVSSIEDEDTESASQAVGVKEEMLRAAIGATQDSQKAAAWVTAHIHKQQVARTKSHYRQLSEAEQAGRTSIEAELDEVLFRMGEKQAMIDALTAEQNAYVPYLAAVSSAIETDTFEGLRKSAEPAAMALHGVLRARNAVFQLQSVQGARTNERAAARLAAIRAVEEAACSAIRRHSPPARNEQKSDEETTSWAEMVEDSE